MARSLVPLMRLRSTLRSYSPTPAAPSSSRLFCTKSTPRGRCFLAVAPPTVPEFHSSSYFESEDNVFIRVLMPGVAEEDVDVHFERNNVVIHGLRKKEAYEEGDTVHVSDFGLRVGAAEHLKLSEMKVVMNNGILKVVIPKAAKGGGGGFF
ncbi:23.6 kDa heat shock protein, mitochondrial-like [Rhododendron vialii]|uniref:23.6 kDa heat shock protein, mitochondrial-like n=1 Tax=Rhododendron vialii TaxID=182163 RepID=UPI00265E5430|nr:23.6 kDa heat shock protein, mitochondrial-like [Rhododendron vialii]